MYTVPYVKVLRDVDGVLDGHVDRPYVVGGGRRELAVLWLLNHEGLQPRARRPHPSLHRRQRWKVFQLTFTPKVRGRHWLP